MSAKTWDQRNHFLVKLKHPADLHESWFFSDEKNASKTKNPFGEITRDYV